MNARFSHRRAGFTLMEMMITLAVFVLLAAAVFGLMTGVLQSTSTLQDNQNRRDQIAALNAYLKSQFSAMDAKSTVSSYLRGQGEGLNQNGIILGTVNFATAIDAKVQANSYYTLRVATYASEPPSSRQDARQDARSVLQQLVTTDDPTVSWTKLIADVKTVDWKFQDLNVTDWVEQWNLGSNPNLVEFMMQAGGDLQPTTMDFWIPKIDQIAVRIAAEPKTTGTTGTH